MAHVEIRLEHAGRGWLVSFANADADARVRGVARLKGSGFVYQDMHTPLSKDVIAKARKLVKVS